MESVTALRESSPVASTAERRSADRDTGRYWKPLGHRSVSRRRSMDKGFHAGLRARAAELNDVQEGRRDAAEECAGCAAMLFELIDSEGVWEESCKDRQSVGSGKSGSVSVNHG